MNNISLLSDDIRSEFSIDEQGKAFASRRAIARLAGVDEKAIRELLKRITSAEQKLAVMLKPIAGQSFEGAELIPDFVVTLIIQYYAYGCQERYRTEQAQLVCAAFQAIGFRVWLQSELGWQKPQVPISPFEMIAQMAMESAKLEKRLNQAEQAINHLVTIQRQAEEELKALPIAQLPAPEKPVRAKVNEIVRNYVTRTKASHQSAWSKLYRELYYRCHIDVEARAKKGKAKLDVVEEAGYMEQLHAIASEIFV